MHAERSTGTFHAIKGVDYHSTLSSIAAEFGAKHSLNHVGNWSGDIGI